jgi:hypothetical protein
MTISENLWTLALAAVVAIGLPTAILTAVLVAP